MDAQICSSPRSVLIPDAGSAELTDLRNQRPQMSVEAFVRIDCLPFDNIVSIKRKLQSLGKTEVSCFQSTYDSSLAETQFQESLGSFGLLNLLNGIIDDRRRRHLSIFE